MASALPALPRTRIDRRNAVTIKLLFITGLVLLLQLPLHWVNSLRQERAQLRAQVTGLAYVETAISAADEAAKRAEVVFGGYRLVYRSLKYSVLVLALVFAAFFLFEMLASVRLHPFHYGLVGAALCLFYLALLAVGEVTTPGPAYLVAAVASSLLITCYSAAILRSWARATIVAALLAAVHGVLFVILRTESHALLAGTGALFAALAAVMYFTRNIDWFAQENAAASAEGAK